MAHLSVVAIVYVLQLPFSAVAARRLRRREPAAATPAPAAKPSAAPTTPVPAKPAADRVVSFEPRPGQRPG